MKKIGANLIIAIIAIATLIACKSKKAEKGTTEVSERETKKEDGTRIKFTCIGNKTHFRGRQLFSHRHFCCCQWMERKEDYHCKVSSFTENQRNVYQGG